MGELAVAEGKDKLTAQGVGSCAVISLYDPKRKIGGLIHAMLPLSKEHTSIHGQVSGDEKIYLHYVDSAIDETIIRKMVEKGSRKQDLEAKLTGGANMFALASSDIGMEDVLSAKEKIKKEGIKLIRESVGGSQGRSVEFCVATGIMTVKMEF